MKVTVYMADHTLITCPNALNNQGKAEYINKKEQAILTNMIQKRGLNVENVLNGTPLEKVTPTMFADATKRLSKLPEVTE